MANFPGTSGNDTITGTGGDDVITGLGGGDKIDGGAGADIIDGGAGNDIIKGGDGDDVITGGLGNDNIVGGAGRDTAIYSVSVASAANTTTPMAYWAGAVLNLGAGADGIDTLNQVEVLRFNGQDFTVTGYARGETYNVVANLGADSNSGNQDAPITGNVLSNDYEVDSVLRVTGLRAAPVSQPAMPLDDPKSVAAPPGDFTLTGQYGVLHLNADGTYSYEATGEGTDHFQYSVTDGGVTRWVNLDITATHLNHGPVANAGSASGEEDATITGQVSASDQDSDPLTYSLVSGPSHGSLTFHANGSYSYTPDADYNGSDSFSFRASDGSLASDDAAVVLNVSPVNDAPVIDEDAPVTVGTPLAGAVSNLVVTTLGHVDAYGRLYSDGNATLEDVAAATGFSVEFLAGLGSFVGGSILQIDFDLPDGSFQFSIDRAEVFVIDTHDRVFANFTWAGSSNDRDATEDMQDPMIGGFWDAPLEGRHGTLIFALIDYAGDVDVSSLGWGYVGYDGPNGDYVHLGLPILSAPAEDTVFSGQFHAHDVDGDPLTFSLVDGHGPAHGSVSIQSDGHFVYTPDADYNGSDSFQYQVSDGHGGTDTATFSFDVAPVNDDPVTSDVSASTVEDTSLSGTLHATDIDSENLSFELYYGPEHGSVTVNSDGAYTYTPDSDYYGGDGFDYFVLDGDGGYAMGHVTISVEPVNDAPVILDYEQVTAAFAPVAFGGHVVTEGLSTILYTEGSNGRDLSTDLGLDFVTDNAGSAATFEVVGDDDGNIDVQFNATPGSSGDDLLALFVDGRYLGLGGLGGPFSLTLNVGTGAHTLSVMVLDYGAPDTAPGSVAVSYPARIVDYSQISTNEDTPVSGLVKATDVDGDGLTYSLTPTGDAAHGHVVMGSDGHYSYTPDPDYNGSDSFTFQVSDGHGGTDTATVSINVTSANDAPETAGGGFEGFENQAISGQVSASDIDGDSLSFSVGAGVGHGSLSFNSDGTFTYTPTHDYVGSDSFTYSVSDGHGGTATGTVELTVTEHNYVPVPTGGSFTLDEDSSYSGQVGGTDLDGDPLVFLVQTGVSHGQLSADTQGNFYYTPDANYHGTDSYTYVANDGKSESAPVTVTFTINPVNDAPSVGRLFRKQTDEDHAISGQVTGGDVDGDAVSYELVGDAPLGLTFQGDGSWTYDPTVDAAMQALSDGESASVSFLVRAYDGHAYSSTRTQTITVNGLNETITGTEGKDAISGSASGDNINALGGDDTVRALGGNDLVNGGDGSDKLFGGDGQDELHGGAGADTVNGEAGGDTLYGDAGSDTMDGGDGDDTVSGGDDNDVVKGGAGNDHVYGDAGADDVQGGSGDDWIYGGAGADRLSGGTGADHFVFLEGDLGSSLATSDTITDFKAVQGDVLDFSGIDADTTLDGDQGFNLVGSFGHHAGEMTMAFNVGINATVISMDTNGDGVADYVLQLTGNVTSTGGWML